MVQRSLVKLIEQENLTQNEAKMLMGNILEGKLSSAQIAAVLTAFRIKGETVEELSGLAASMQAKALRLPKMLQHAVDTCGTGGDGGKTFNISTASAIVAAAAGVPVAKHGNRRYRGRVAVPMCWRLWISIFK